MSDRPDFPLKGCPPDIFLIRRGTCKLKGMRLPQSSSQPLFLRVSAITLFLTLATVLPAAGTEQLVCTPASLRFGAVTVGQTETQLLALSNVGNTSVTISASSFNNSEFTLSGLKLPAVLPAGQTVEVSVIFAPTARGWTGAAVTFTS